MRNVVVVAILEIDLFYVVFILGAGSGIFMLWGRFRYIYVVFTDNTDSGQ